MNRHYQTLVFAIPTPAPGEQLDSREEQDNGELAKLVHHPWVVARAEGDLLRRHPVKAPAADAVNHPAHYTSHPSGIEAIQITRHESFCRGNAIKYLLRAGRKSADPREDLRKAIAYIQFELEDLEKVSPPALSGSSSE